MNNTPTTDDTGVATHLEISSAEIGSIRETFEKAHLQQRCQIAAALLESEGSLLGIVKIVGRNISWVYNLTRMSKLHPRLFQFLETKNIKQKMLRSSAVLLAKFDHDTQLKIWAAVEDVDMGWQKEHKINKIIDGMSRGEPIGTATPEIRDAIPPKPRITYVREVEKTAEKPNMDKATAFLRSKAKKPEPQEIFKPFGPEDFRPGPNYEFAG